MKAVIKKDYGPMELEYTDIAKPEIGEYDVLIKVKAAAICGSDLSLMYGTVTGKQVPYPIVIGHEFAGEICETGSKVKRWKVGDRVVSDNTGYVCGVCHACSKGEYLFCSHRKGMGNDMDGGFAYYVKIHGDVLMTFPNCLYRIPDHVSYEAASMMDPLCNGYKAVIQEGELLPGQNIVVFGCGAMGLFAMNAARLASAAKIIAVGMAEDKEVRFALAEKLGATDFVVADEEENVADKVKEIAGLEGVAVVVDAAGAPVVLQQAIDMTRNGGKIIKIGYSSKPVGFSLDTMALKGIVLIGHMGYDSTSWKNCLALLEKGEIDMEAFISHRLPLSKWEEGMELVKNRQATKVILLPEEDGALS